MKTFHLLLGVLLIVVSLSSCNKENRETTVDGRVITYGTETKATSEQLRMGLYRATSAGIFQSGEQLMQETQTDTNGNFHFSFKAEGSLNYYLRLLNNEVASHFVEGGYALQLGYPKQLSGAKQKIDFVLHPYAWVKLHLINNGPYYPGDKIRFDLGTSGIQERFGPVNQQGVYLVYGNMKCTVSYSVFRNNDVSSFKDTIPFVSAYDTTYHLIEY